MNRPRVRITVRSVPLIVASIAVLLTCIRAIERSIIRGQIDELEGNQRRWEGYLAEQLAEGDGLRAGQSLDVVNRCKVERADLMRKLDGFPRSFSARSASFALVYIWIITLSMIVYSERRPRPEPDVFYIPARQRPSPFRLWVWSGLFAPLAMLTLGVTFARKTGNNGPATWAEVAVDTLDWLQIVHAMVGVVILKGRRGAAFLLGLLSIAISWWIWLHCHMSVTGWWL